MVARMADLMTALRNADAAGDTEAASRIAAMINAQQQPVPQQAQDDWMPTEANLTAEQARTDAIPDSTIGEKITAGGEVLSALGTGLVAGAPAGFIGSVEGIARELTGNVPTGEGHKIAQEYSQAVTDTPDTPLGQKWMKNIGDALGVLPPVLGATPVATMLPRKMLTSKAGGLVDRAGNLTPKIERALADKGITTGNLVDLAKAKDTAISAAGSGIIKNKNVVKKAVENIVSQQLKGKSRDDGLFNVKLLNGKIVDDAVAIKAEQNGFTPAVVQLAKTANKETQKAMSDALNVAFDGTKNSRVFQDKRPTDMAGDALFERVAYIKEKANTARKDLDDIAKNELKGKEFNPKPLVSTIDDIFSELDITNKGKRGLPKPDFKGSQISGDPSSQRAISEMIRMIGETKRNDSLGAHMMKRQLDNLIDFSKNSSDGLGKSGKDALKKVRATLNETLRADSKGYAAANDVMSQSLTALDDLQKAVGKSVNLSAKGANQALGTGIRGLFSNRQKRLELDNAFNQVDEVAANLGGDFKKSYKDISQFTNKIEDVFGTVAETSLKGDVAAAKSVIDRGFTATAIDKGADLITKKKKKNDFDAYDSMRELLKGDKK